jgi:hypothetical protein
MFLPKKSPAKNLPSEDILAKNFPTKNVPTKNIPTKYWHWEPPANLEIWQYKDNLLALYPHIEFFYTLTIP